jgi:hypothetical protein
MNSLASSILYKPVYRGLAKSVNAPPFLRGAAIQVCHHGSMRHAVLLPALLALALAAQQPPTRTEAPSPTDLVLPSGKTWKEELIAHNHAQNLRDAQRLADLSAQIAQELEDGGRYVFSLKTLKKVEEAEKLAKTIRERMRQN